MDVELEFTTSCGPGKKDRLFSEYVWCTELMNPQKVRLCRLLGATGGTSWLPVGVLFPHLDLSLNQTGGFPADCDYEDRPLNLSPDPFVPRHFAALAALAAYLHGRYLVIYQRFGSMEHQYFGVAVRAFHRG